MVNLTRIYTRTGDAGRTRLGDMSETTKTDTRLLAYAIGDEDLEARIRYYGRFGLRPMNRTTRGWTRHPERN